MVFTKIGFRSLTKQTGSLYSFVSHPWIRQHFSNTFRTAWREKHNNPAKSTTTTTHTWTNNYSSKVAGSHKLILLSY